MIARVASIAPFSPPETGESRKRSILAAQSRATDGWIDEVSTHSALGFAATAPCEPNHDAGS